MYKYYNRYKTMINDNTFNVMPFIKLIPKDTDKFIIYDQNKTRLDKVSQEYYNTPYFGWLILQANPEYSYEYDIPNGTAIRIPYPLEATVNEYEAELNKYKFNYVN